MSRKHVFSLLIVLALLVMFSTVAFAGSREAPLTQDGMTMPTETPAPLPTAVMPMNPQMGVSGAYDGATAGTMATGTCPMMSGMGSMSGMSGMSGMNGMSGMGSMSGMSGMSGMNGMNGMSGMNGTTGMTGMNGTSGMNGMAYYPTSIWDLNPWLLIGWVVLGLVLLTVLAGIVYAGIRLIRAIPPRPASQVSFDK